MFNLLVSYSGWTPPKGTISKGRFLTQTEQHVLGIVSPGNKSDLPLLCSFKALLMPEIGSADAEPFGEIGTIQNITDCGSEYRFDFYLDHSVPPIPVDQIQEMASEFGVSGFGLSNTHWSVKDSDLFEMLYRRTITPSDGSGPFSVSRLPIKSRQIAVMMPFDGKFNIVRDALFELAKSLSCDCVRADNVWQNDVLIQDIIDLIVESKLVICDATGRNPNVFYEAGIAHALGKRVIVITQNPDDIPFDLRHLRYVHYLGNSEGVANLKKSLMDKVREVIDE